MDLPAEFASLDSSRIDPNDTIPSNIDLSKMAFLSGFLSAPLTFFVPNLRTTVLSKDNGDSVTLWSYITRNPDPTGWTVVESALIRSDTRYTPSGRFPVYLNKSTPGTEYLIGCDVAVCVHKYEPWIVETYNTSIVPPSVLRVVEKGYGGPSPSPSGNIRGAPITNTRNLNTTGKFPVFLVAYGSSGDQVESENGRSRPYFPFPTVGPVVPPHTTSLLTSTYSTARLFHRRCWTRGVHRTLSRSGRHDPRTGQCS